MRKIALILVLTVTACTVPKLDTSGEEKEPKLSQAERATVATAQKSGALVLVDKSDRRLTYF